MGIYSEGDNFYYMRARYYNAELSRFISEDPAGFIDGPNLYAYVGGNPIGFVDPLGLDAINSTNPLRVIGKELPRWWNSNETADLRNGLRTTITVAGIPIRGISYLDTALDGYDIYGNINNGDNEEALNITLSNVAGEGVSHFMKSINRVNEVVDRAISTGVSEFFSRVIEKDSINSKKDND